VILFWESLKMIFFKIYSVWWPLSLELSNLGCYFINRKEWVIISTRSHKLLPEWIFSNNYYDACVQDDFIVWDGDVSLRGKDRHLFLFKNKLLLTRKKKPEFSGELPTYEYRGTVDVCVIIVWSESHRIDNKQQLFVKNLI